MKHKILSLNKELFPKENKALEPKEQLQLKLLKWYRFFKCTKVKHERTEKADSLQLMQEYAGLCLGKSWNKAVTQPLDWRQIPKRWSSSS